MAVTAGLSGVILSGCTPVEKKPAEIATPNHDEAVITDAPEQFQEDDTDAGSLEIDFKKLQADNPEIFGWLRVPGTSIDEPLLQSFDEPDRYKTHDAYLKPDSKGAAYIEIYNMDDMCDFNTIIHGSKELFGDIVNYENPEFFENNYEFYVYLPDNVLTYTIWAVYRRENIDLFESYGFADAVGSREFLDDVYNEKVIGKQIRDGWDNMDEYKFLTTLTIDTDEEQQLVVIGALTDDAAGTIHRDVVEYLDLGPNLLEDN